MLKIGIIIGTTRPERRTPVMANWLLDIASERADAIFEIVDVQDYGLPVLDEPVPSAQNKYSKPHTKNLGR